LSNLIHASNRLFGIDTESCILQFASPSFDVAVWEIFMALTSGGSLCLLSGNTRFVALELPKILHGKCITMALLPPSILAVLPTEDLSNLCTVVAVGERCSTEIVKRWSPGRSFFNCYGPAEATITVSGYLTNINQTYSSQGPPIGRPISNTKLYVLDQYLQPVPVGVQGELHIGGVGLARGYLNLPELTEEKFISNPFDNERDSRLYKTGDLVRYLPDGNLEFFGRKDCQVKFRGFRIELGEIETVLQEHSAVQDAVVIVREDIPRLKRLVAYIIPCHKQPPAVTELRSFLKKKLPQYMIPGIYVILETLPLNPNGKVDRDALPVP